MAITLVYFYKFYSLTFTKKSYFFLYFHKPHELPKKPLKTIW
jgi:hypothetical protein